ncbi:MAG: hypothetical protein M4D80_02755 [Myxococcota bacterium]|nr:hypothetical protein [Deltaproteobacteria bacterium]MDQ3334054.1 hypothetical protein [Myxococcota bacterium]
MKLLTFMLVLAACTPEVEDADLDNDEELGAILDDTSEPEQEAVDAETSETSLKVGTKCSKQRFLHVANYSFVGELSSCVNGVCPNGCWGSQRRTSGFACDYDASAADRVKTRDGGLAFASYNEIKPLNADDATAVANCRAQSGHGIRTYAVWNGSGWSNEGIAASVRFAELYGPQNEASPHFARWYQSWRATWSPMTNVSPETGVSFDDVKRTVAKICSATRTGWLGLYFYDGDAAGGAGMAAWKREAIIRGMNYCTTH